MSDERRICEDERCHWDDWAGKRTIYTPHGIPDKEPGYKPCQRDHGLPGEIEALLRRRLWSSGGGPVGGIYDVVWELIDRFVSGFPEQGDDEGVE